MNARQRKLILQRTILKSVRKPQAEKVESAQWEVLPTVKPVVMVDVDWKPAEEFQSQSRLNRRVEHDVSNMLDRETRFDWDSLRKELEANGGLRNVSIPAIAPTHPGEGCEDAGIPLPPQADYLSLNTGIELRDYQIEAMNRIREFSLKHPIVFEMPSRHTSLMLNALRRAEQEPMIIMSTPRKHDDNSVLSELSVSMLKERMMSEAGGEFRINLENLSITEEPENKNGN